MFKFDLSEKVTVVLSGQSGAVTARSDSQEANNCYQVAHLNAQGNAVKRWYFEDELKATEA